MSLLSIVQFTDDNDDDTPKNSWTRLSMFFIRFSVSSRDLRVCVPSSLSSNKYKCMLQPLDLDVLVVETMVPDEEMLITVLELKPVPVVCLWLAEEDGSKIRHGRREKHTTTKPAAGWGIRGMIQHTSGSASATATIHAELLIAEA